MMQKLQMSRVGLGITFLAIGALIVILEVFLTGPQNASLLFTLVFWVALTQGCIALVAAADLSKARWIRPIKRELLSVYPLILFSAILFLFVGLKLEIYPWATHQNGWLNKSFFLIRNVVSLVLAFLFAWKFSIESSKESEKTKFYAVLYILFFVISQSLVAYDWVMTLEYPWISTLFGPYFFVESLYVGIALAGLVCLWLLGQADQEETATLTKSLTDTATLMFGFALFWAGLFFAQYLVIWYGNIPEETGFLVKRISTSPLKELSVLTLVALFFVPFLAFLPRRAKTSPRSISLISSAVIAGIFLERLVFMIPATSMNVLLIVFETVAMGLLFAAVISNRTQFVPAPRE